MSNEPAVVVKDLYKTFKLPHEQHSGIKQALIGMFKGGKRGHETQRVLNDISFEIKKGEFFGIVGRNGSGKSTLLKLLAGIYTADKGSVQVNGSLTPFIELGVGFNPELTGRENVYMNGALLGFSHSEMDTMYDDIIEFAELERFMDQKLKNYSSGMQVRLAFSIAIRAQSDILLIDEVLAVGDSAFQQKCYEVFFELKQRGVTIILVTHDMGAVLKFCDRALLLDRGRVAGIGKPFDISEEYLEQNYNVNESQSTSKVERDSINRSMTYIESASISPVDTDNIPDAYETGSEVAIKIKPKKVGSEPFNIGVQIFNSDGVYCFGSNTRIDKFKIPTDSNELLVTMKLDLLPGNYFLNMATMNASATSVRNYHSKIIKFRIKKATEVEGVVDLSREWSS